MECRANVPVQCVTPTCSSIMWRPWRPPNVLRKLGVNVVGAPASQQLPPSVQARHLSLARLPLVSQHALGRRRGFCAQRSRPCVFFFKAPCFRSLGPCARLHRCWCPTSPRRRCAPSRGNQQCGRAVCVLLLCGQLLQSTAQSAAYPWQGGARVARTAIIFVWPRSHSAESASCR